MNPDSNVLYVYCCAACNHRGELHLAGDSHNGEARTCTICGGRVTLEWDGGATFETSLARTEESGLTDIEIAALTRIAPLEKWDLVWQEDVREWHTAVECPCCDAWLRYEVSALDDFHCTECDYDWLDGRHQLPTPAKI
ncbi:hypothetical protein G3O06_23525 [Burkholderia sp. Ac-20345]|uniref:hypothetical protein n=1 Tax=Burkholderia sp. Ac-20345 TaxID=2703891 RepID=UPI00197BA725|nr:hypothetical protein [Burkholderia sp. Ac-20345]MBN3780488.1 hypothetical protein [Burkholderia sp. Ac-20345]